MYVFSTGLSVPPSRFSGFSRTGFCSSPELPAERRWAGVGLNIINVWKLSVKAEVFFPFQKPFLAKLCTLSALGVVFALFLFQA